MPGSLGGRQLRYGPLLDSLAGYLEEAGLGTVTTQAAVEWAMLPQGVHPHRWKQRLDAARGFARYLAASDPEAEVPLPDSGYIVKRSARPGPSCSGGRSSTRTMNRGRPAELIKKTLKIYPYQPGGYGTSIGTALTVVKSCSGPAVPLSSS